MNLHLGTSGYSYKEWKGIFYPADLPAKRMLAFYAQHFNAVEINNTFHRMPTEALLQSWAGEVAGDFKFILKAPQQITHRQRLKDSGQSVEHLCAVATTLGERLGPILFQLPPNLKKDAARLEEFLSILPPAIAAAFEFRHQSWFDEEIFALLRAHQAAMCVAEAEGELNVPFVSTADWGYLRLRLPEYSKHDLRAWAARIREANWREAYVFFKHEDEARGPAFAHQFLSIFKGLNT